MSYAKKFVESKGRDCVIERYVLEEEFEDEEPTKVYAPYSTKISIRRTTRASRELGIRASYWDGLIPIESKLSSGEIIAVTDEYSITQYIIQHANYDPQSRMIAFFCARCNVVMDHVRLVEGMDENFNPTSEWQTLNAEVPCYGEIVNQKIRQEVPGLLEGTIYIFQVPKVLDIKELDRIKYNNKNYQVVSIDDVGLAGVAQIQLQKDLRPD